MRIYISHSIRGKYGKEATPEQMKANNLRAITFSKQIKKAFPDKDFYCPGEHDEFVLIAFKNKIINEEQILRVDCCIIDSCDLLINYIPDGYISNGMWIENRHALLAGKTILLMKNEKNFNLLNRYLEGLKQ